MYRDKYLIKIVELCDDKFFISPDNGHERFRSWKIIYRFRFNIAE